MFHKKAILLFAGFFLTLAASSLDAQIIKQGAKQLPRALEKNVATSAATSSAWKNFAGTLPSVSAAASLNTQVAPPQSFKSKMAQKYPGAVATYEQKVNGRSLQQALRRVVELRGETPSKGWPRKSEHSLTVQNMDGLTLDGYTGDCPPLPIPTNKIYLYRGMGLAEPALRNVLKNGLRAQDTGKDSNALGTQMRLVGMGTMPVSSDMLKDMDVRQTYLTPKAEETLHFAYGNSFEEGRIPVVVTVRGWRKDNFHHVTSEDIPASDFVEVSALIKGPQGDPIWCKVDLTADGQSLVFTPYLPKQ